MSKPLEIECKWWEPMWWSVTRFVDNWVYPAHSLRNFLFGRYDIVKLHNVKRTQYCDVTERMLLANMELIREFIEDENPTEHVAWYKDDDGVDVGHRYGECKDNGFPVLYPEYDGKYIFDIIKEIYDWWRFDYVRLCSDMDYITDYMHRTFWGVMRIGEYGEIVWDRTGIENVRREDWDVLDRYCEGDRENAKSKEFMSKKLMWLEAEIERQKQKYLHLCIEVRPYLWT